MQSLSSTKAKDFSQIFSFAKTSKILKIIENHHLLRNISIKILYICKLLLINSNFEIQKFYLITIFLNWQI